MRGFLKILVAAGALGLVVFFWLSAQVVEVHPMKAGSADLRFHEAVQRYEDPRPLLQMDSAGRVRQTPVHERKSSALIPIKPTDLHLLAWTAEPGVGLVEAEIPIWFLRLKAPALRLMLRKTRFDPAPWNFDVSAIEDWGPGVVLDHRAGKQRFLIWTE